MLQDLGREIERVVQDSLLDAVSDMAGRKKVGTFEIQLKVIQAVSKRFPIKRVEVWGNGVSFSVGDYDVTVGYIDRKETKLGYSICLKNVCRRLNKSLKWWLKKAFLGEEEMPGWEEEIDELARKLGRVLWES